MRGEKGEGGGGGKLCCRSIMLCLRSRVEHSGAERYSGVEWSQVLIIWFG